MAGRYWNKEEIDYLRHHSHLSMAQLKKNLKRSEASIRTKASKEGIHIEFKEDAFSINRLTRLFGLSDGTIKRVWIPRGLNFKKFNGYGYRVKFDDLASFLRNNLDLISLIECDEHYLFVDCEWYQDKMQSDKELNYSVKKYAKVDAGLKRKIIQMYRDGCTITSIADNVNMTYSQIKWHLYGKGWADEALRR